MSNEQRSGAAATGTSASSAKARAGPVDHLSVRGEIGRIRRQTVAYACRTRAMRRLRHQQEVEIHLDGEDEVVLGCRVLGVEGSVATLGSLDGGPGTLLGGSVPAVPGYLLFDHGGGKVALKGIATASTTEGPELLFVVLDGVQLPERRSAARAQVNAVARMFRLDSVQESDCLETRLADLSISGMRVEGHRGLNGATGYRLELYIGDAQTPIRCGAEVARRTPTHVGLKFIDLQDADRALLEAIVRAHAQS